jgi:hypothetical protein
MESLGKPLPPGNIDPKTSRQERADRSQAVVVGDDAQTSTRQETKREKYNLGEQTPESIKGLLNQWVIIMK